MGEIAGHSLHELACLSSLTSLTLHRVTNPLSAAKCFGPCLRRLDLMLMDTEYQTIYPCLLRCTSLDTLLLRREPFVGVAYGGDSPLFDLESWKTLLRSIGPPLSSLEIPFSLTQPRHRNLVLRYCPRLVHFAIC